MGKTCHDESFRGGREAGDTNLCRAAFYRLGSASVRLVAEYRLNECRDCLGILEIGELHFYLHS